jgi:hypothetical protein
MTQRERRALLQRLPPAPIAQEAYPHAAGYARQEAEAVTGHQRVRRSLKPSRVWYRVPRYCGLNGPPEAGLPAVCVLGGPEC